MSLTKHNITYKPFQYPWAMEAATQHEKIHWIEDEVTLGDDMTQWGSKLTPQEKNLITQILKLFTTSDVVVGGNYAEFYIPYFKNNEIRSMLLSFASREGIHQRAYSLLNDTLGLPEEYYNAFAEYEALANKVEFMQDIDISTQAGVAKAIARSVLSEGVSLFSAFAMLFNFSRFGKMPGMCTVVEWSIRDETLHANGMAKLFTEFCKEHPRIVTDEFKSDIYQMFRDNIKLEDKVIDLAFEMGAVEGLTADDVKHYVRHVANRRLVDLGLKPNWTRIKDNPLPFMEYLLGDSHTNFFEQRVTDYNAAGMEGDWGWEETFNNQEDTLALP